MRGRLFRSSCRSARAGLALTLFLTGACTATPPPPAAPAANPGDAAFSALAKEILQDSFRRHPTNATDLGIHTYDTVMDDGSAKAVADESGALKGFLARLTAVDAASLSSTTSSTASS